MDVFVNQRNRCEVDVLMMMVGVGWDGDRDGAALVIGIDIIGIVGNIGIIIQLFKGCPWDSDIVKC